MRTLVVYGTKYGSAAKAAEILSDRLPGTADVFRLGIDAIPSVDDYDAVVIGGSIYMGRVQEPVKEFCRDNLEGLRSKRVGLYLCCGEQDETKRAAYFPASFPGLTDTAAAVEWFGEEFYFEKASLPHRIAVRILKSVRESYSRLREDAIDAFARTIGSQDRPGEPPCD